MHILTIIQARMSSSRLPGKVLLSYRDQTLLGIQLNRLRRSTHPFEIIVATSTDPSDDSIQGYCDDNQIRCFRGDRLNVAQRFYEILSQHTASLCVRYCADRPWFDPALLDQALNHIIESQSDIVTNVFPATFPKGQSVEVFHVASFLKCYQSMQTPSDQEHVTSHFYKNHDQFKIHNFTSTQPQYAHLNLCIDTNDDFVKFKKVADYLNDSFLTAPWETVAQLYQGLK